MSGSCFFSYVWTVNKKKNAGFKKSIIKSRSIYDIITINCNNITFSNYSANTHHYPI